MNKIEVNAKLQYAFGGLPLSKAQKQMLAEVICDVIENAVSDSKNYTLPAATKLMFKRNIKTNRDEPIEAYTKEEVDELLKEYNVEVKNKIMYDYVFAATMCKADYLGKSIPDKEHLAMYVKDTIDDVDASDETTFRRWVATMVGNGLPIDWYEIC